MRTLFTKEKSKSRLVLRVKPTPTRFPAKCLYSDGQHTLAFYIKYVPPVGLAPLVGSGVPSGPGIRVAAYTEPPLLYCINVYQWRWIAPKVERVMQP